MPRQRKATVGKRETATFRRGLWNAERVLANVIVGVIDLGPVVFREVCCHTLAVSSPINVLSARYSRDVVSAHSASPLSSLGCGAGANYGQWPNGSRRGSGAGSCGPGS